MTKAVVSPDASVTEALACLDASGLGLLLICDDGGELKGVLTDGDFRRAILENTDLSRACIELATTEPLVAPPEITPVEALCLMDEGRSFAVNHLPLVNAEGKPVDLWLRRDLVSSEESEMEAVIMAGGFGTRLRSLTRDTPKPMLQVGDQPLIERLVEQVRDAGVKDLHITTHFMAEKINGHFGDGSRFGVSIGYVDESQPLGTAGALGLLERPKKPTLIVNGDILTDVDFRSMLQFHSEHSAQMTVGVRQYDIKVPYGVLECAGVDVEAIVEKPSYPVLVNAGVYIIDPVAYDFIPKDQRYDMTDLMMRLVEDGRKVVSFPIIEYWLDIGQPADLEKAQADAKEARLAK